MEGVATSDVSDARDYAGRLKIQCGVVPLSRTSAHQPRAPWRETA
jgi:hypothetical protein